MQDKKAGQRPFLLEHWRPEFIPDLLRFADNKKIADNLRDVFPHPYTREAAEEYIRAVGQGEGERSLCRAIVVDGCAAGSIGLFWGTDVYRKTAELGYWLAEEYWGEGIMSRAVAELCRTAFEQRDLVRIFAEPYAYNTASRRVLEKAGFALEGIMRRGACKNGEIIDYCMYALLWTGK